MYDKVGAFKRSSRRGGAGTVAPVATLSLQAATAIGYPRAVGVVAGKAALYDPATSLSGAFVGITQHAAGLGATVNIQTHGELTYAGWGLTVDAVYYAGVNGVITPVAPVIGSVQPVGVAVAADRLLINAPRAVDLI